MSDAQVLDALVGRWAATRAQLSDAVVRTLLAAWSDIDPYDDDAVRAFAQAAAATSFAGQQRAVELSEAYLRSVLSVLGVSLPRGRLAFLEGPVRAGVDMLAVYTRPAETFRYLLSQKASRPDAATQARRRLTLLADTDVSLAARSAEPHVLAASDRITGYRRVLRPELAKHGVCGLCIVAADRIYKRERLKALHNGCNCVTMPVTRNADPGAGMNDADIAKVYKAADGKTDRGALQRVRVEVVEHGELGPVLTDQRHSFRGPDEIAA